MGVREWAILALLSVIWGASFFFYRVMVTELGPLTIVFGRLGLAAVALHLFLATRGQWVDFPLSTWARLAGLSLINNAAPFTLIAYSEQRITGGTAALINAAVPMMTVVTAHYLTHDEKFSFHRGAGVVLGLLGVGVLIGGDVIQGLTSDVVGELICFGAAVLYAFSGVYARSFAGLPPLKVATGQVTMGTLWTLPLMLIVDKPWRLAAPSAPVIGSLLAISLVGTAFAYIVFFRLIGRTGALNMSLVALLQPVSAMFLGWLILAEPITTKAIAGMAIIGMGLICIDGRLVRWLRARFAGPPGLC
jgi:drug/metabolite transporter (DMT)-like permease